MRFILRLLAGSSLLAFSTLSIAENTSLDFESGEASLQAWTFSGQQPWLLDNTTPLNGTYSLKSGPIANFEVSIAELVSTHDSQLIFFNFRVSSEADYDFLEFYINNELKEKWSGEQAKMVVFEHNVQKAAYKWIYRTDGSVTGNQDTSWLDNVVITSDLNYDFDTDGVADRWEVTHFGSLAIDMNADPDNDGLNNLQEYQLQTNPNNADTDNDGMPDGWEHQNGLDASNPSDGVQDVDGDGFDNLTEYLVGTDPNDISDVPTVTLVNFEAGTKSPFYWKTVSDTQPWKVITNGAISGTYSLSSNDLELKVGAVQQDSVTEIKIYNRGGRLAFNYKTIMDDIFNDSEFLEFKIDGVSKQKWFANNEGRFVADLSEGWHTLTWVRRNARGNLDKEYEVLIDNVIIDADPQYDSDNDGIPDGWELVHFNSLTVDHSLDSDGDGLTNLQEFDSGTDPSKADTDSDKISDGWELQYGLDPFDRRDAVLDSDGDLFSNYEEFLADTAPNIPTDFPQGTHVDFEGEQLAPLNWTTGGELPWSFNTTVFSEGLQSISSSHADFDRVSDLTVSFQSAGGFAKFDYLVDSQCGELSIYLNNELVEALYGQFRKGITLPFTTDYILEVPQGANSIRWSFKKVNVPSELGCSSVAFAALDNFFVTGFDILDDTPPGAVTPSLSASPDGTSIAIDWSDYSEVDNGDDIAGYRVYQSVNAFSDTAQAVLVGEVDNSVKNYQLNNLLRNTEYHIAVVAVDIVGNVLEQVTPSSVITIDSVAPDEVTNLSVVSKDTGIDLSWTASNSVDVTEYWLILNNATPLRVPATNLNYSFTGLASDSAFELIIKAVDGSNNASQGVSKKIATLYDNPSITDIESLSGKVKLNWIAPADIAGFEFYKIYISRSPITDVSTLRHDFIVSRNANTVTLSRLTNGVEYHFALAIENINGFKKTLVSSMSATPTADNEAPEITSVKLNGVEAADGVIVSGDTSVVVTAQDQSGVSRVEFYLDGVLFDTKFSSNGVFSSNISIDNVTDGNHNLLIKAYDTLDFSTELVRVIDVDLPAPGAPVWSTPANNSTTNESRIDVVAQADAAEYQISNNGSVIQDWTAYSGTQFQANIELNEGENRLTAKVRNRGGESIDSSVLVVNLDTTVPEAPTGLVATSKAMGQVQLSWNASSGDRVAGYDVYRSNAPFDSLLTATRVNTQHLSVTRFDDMPEDDGTYHYRVVAINELETPSQLSNTVEATADSIAPTATLSYEPLGAYDAATDTYGRGEVNVTIEVSEPLLTAPFVAIKPADGAIQMLDLQKSSETIYTAKLVINQDNQSGMSTATFSAKDKIGNQGTDITEGLSIKIDSKGPSVIALTTEPAHPIQNDELAPVSVTVNFILDEAVKDGSTPILSYRLSGTNRTETSIDNVTALAEQNQWTASFVLPSDAGLAEVELLSFMYQAEDALSNVSTEIDNSNRIQVYQGDLPPLDTPFGLKAEAQAAGQIKISWFEIPEAADYQIYRQAPQETQLTEFIRVGSGNTLEYLDSTNLDGEYRYAIASVRQSNGEETLSAMSEVVIASADSQLPESPTNLTLELTPVGIQANWELSPSDDTVSYQLYRSQMNPISSIDGLDPAIEGIPATSPSVVDQNPMQTLPAYVVVAVDAAGNLSAPSNTDYLNVELFPVATLEVEQLLDQNPVVSWTHQNSEIAGFDLYLGDAETGFKVNDGLITAYDFTDSGYANDNRQYTVVAKDSNGVESLPRSIFLPKLDIQLKEGELLKTNLINELEFLVTNHNSQSYNNSRLKLVIAGREHLSETFSLPANSTELIKVVVGGYEELSTISNYEITWESKPSTTETISVKRNGQVEVLPGALNVALETKEMVRGGAGQVRFSIDNTGEAMMELITALSRGNADSRDIRFILRDIDGNVLATTKFKQALGDSVLTLASGQTVVRIPAGQTWVSSWVDFDIPAAAPEQVQLQVQIDNIYRNVGLPEVVTLNGTNTSRDLSLIDTPYTGGAVVVTPQSSFGDTDISIKGKAIERATLSALPNVELKLVITVNGFEKVSNVTTDANGEFSYLYKPDNDESGTYKVSVIHPELTERPDNGQFVINDVIIRPNNLTVRIPKRYTQELPITVTGGDGTNLNNVRFELIAEEQPNATLPTDINLVFAEPVSVGSKERRKLFVQMTPGDNAAEQGSFVLSLMSDESGVTPIGQAVVNYNLTEAQPALYYSPSFVETGATLEGEVTEVVTLENKGVDTLRDINLELLRQDGFAAPSWLSMNVNANFGDIEVGQQRQLSITARPQNHAAPGVYEFKLRVSSSNHPVRDIPVFVSLTESGVGGYQFKVSDMYTATLDPNGNLIQGLQGATIRIQNEDVPSIEFSLSTNQLGEVLFDNLPAGRYSYWASADKHLEKHGRLDVRPGVIRNESVFLDYQLITLEWSVREITIEDRYEIILTATYEVDVPAAVVVLAPSSATIPDMQPGDVFYGELTITNHGLIRADEIIYNLPQSDQYYQFEFLTSSLPETLEAKEVKRIPYRVTALQSLEPEIDGSGGGCYTYRSCIDTVASYQCANGDDSTSASMSCWTRSYGSCGGPGGPGGGGWFGGGGGAGPGGSGGPGDVPPEQSPLPPCAADGKDCGADGNGSGDQ